jgi:hypothetical protein
MNLYETEMRCFPEVYSFLTELLFTSYTVVKEI